jgi:small-conductance mechanosensitive channel
MQWFHQYYADLLDPKTYPGALFYLVIIGGAAWLAGQAVHLAIHRYLDRAEADGADPTGIRFLGQIGRLAVYVIAFLSYTHVVPGLQKLGTAWLASVGVVSVVVGLAAQSTLSNLVAGISLVLYRPFRIGDRVQIAAPTGTEIGTVESIDLGYTTMRTADGRRLVIPNATIASQTSINLSGCHPNIPCGIALTVAPGEDVSRARNILLDVAKAVPKVEKVDGCFVTRRGDTHKIRFPRKRQKAIRRLQYQSRVSKIFAVAFPYSFATSMTR